MKQLEIDQIKRIRDLMRGQYIRKNTPRTIAELAMNIGLTSAFRHVGQEKLFSLISQAVLVYDEDFQRCQGDGQDSKDRAEMVVYMEVPANYGQRSKRRSA